MFDDGTERDPYDVVIDLNLGYPRGKEAARAQIRPLVDDASCQSIALVDAEPYLRVVAQDEFGSVRKLESENVLLHLEWLCGDGIDIRIRPWGYRIPCRPGAEGVLGIVVALTNIHDKRVVPIGGLLQVVLPEEESLLLLQPEGA